MGDKKNPALIELIIVIFFFSLSAAIIVQLFVTSYQISRQSQKKSMAVIAAQDIAEQLKADPLHPEEALNNWEKTENQDGDYYTAYLDAHMDVVAKEISEYKFTLKIQNIKKDSGILVQIQMSVFDPSNDRSILQFNAGNYVTEGGRL